MAIVLVAGLALSGVAAWRQQVANELALREATRTLADKVAELVVAQVEGVAKGLRGARGYFLGAGLDSAGVEGFRRYMGSRDLPREFPGVLGFSLLRRVSPQAEEAFVNQQRRQGLVDFKVKALQTHVAERLVIQFIEPLAANRGALGLDVSSDPARRASTDQALAGPQPVLTAPLRLQQAGPGASLGAVLLLRFEADSAPPAWGVAGGPPALVSAPFQLDQLLKAVDLSAELVATRVADLTDRAQPVDFALPLPADAAAQAGTAITLDKALMGRQWRFVVTPRPALAASLPLRSPTVVGLTCAVVSCLLAALVQVTVRARRRNDGHLAERTRLLTLLDNAGDAVLGLDTDGRVNLWNRAATQLLGHTTADALGRSLTELGLDAAPGFPGEVERLRGEALAGRVAAPMETQRRHRDGRLVDVEISAGPVFDDGGRVAGVALVLRPIGERLAQRRELEEHRHGLQRAVAERTHELTELGAELRSLIDALPSRLGVWDKALRSQLVNRRYAQDIGSEPGATGERTLPGVLGQKDFAGWQPHVAAALRGEAQRFEWSFRSSDPTAPMRHAQVRLIPRWAGGEVTGFYELTHDITELVVGRQAADAALRERGLLLDALDRFAIVSMADRRGTIIEVNERFCALSQYTRDELIGQNHRIVNSGTHDAGFWRTLWSTIANGRPWQGEICNRARDGTLYWVQSIIVPFLDATGRVERYVSVRFDITPLKLTELALRRGEAMLERTGRVARVGGWEMSLADGALRWTDETCRIHGLPPGHRPTLDEAIGYYAPNARPVIQEQVQRALDTGEPWDVELPMVRADGVAIWVRAIGEVERDGEKPVRLIGAFQDVTAQHEAREALRLQQALVQSMLAAAPVAVRVARLRDNRVQVVNERFCRLVRRSREECEGLDIAPFYVDPAVFADISRRLSAGETVIDQLVELHLPDQPEVPHTWALGSFMVTQYEGEAAVLAWLYDVTELQQARDAARRSKELMLQALEATQTGLAIISAEDTLEMCNARFLKMYPEVAPRLLPGTPFVEVVRAITERYRPSNEPPDTEEWIQQRVGTFRQGGEWVRPLADGRHIRAVERELADRRFVTLRTDVTELMRAREAAEAASVAKSAFVATTSHEIRTPLNAILGLAYLLQREQLPPEAHAHAERIAAAGRTLLGLLNNVLDLSKIEAGQFELEQHPFDLRALAEAELPLLAASAPHPGVQTRVQVDDDVPVLVLGDAGRVRQVLINLLGNALKFTESGAVALAVRCGPQPPLIELEVSDTGIGMDLAAQSRLFQPFEQADASIARRFGGSGLGLSITARLVKLMGGSIDLSSAPGQGSTFTVHLPLPAADGSDGAELATSGAHDQALMAPLRVALFIADAARRDQTWALVRTFGWRCEAAGDEAELTHQLQAAQAADRSLDIVILDEGAGSPASGGEPLVNALAGLPAEHWPGLLALGVAPGVSARLPALPAGCRLSTVAEPLTGSALFDAANRCLAATPARAARLLHTTVGHADNLVWLPGLRVLVVDDNSLNLDVARMVLQLEGAEVVTCDSGEEALAVLSETANQFDAGVLDVQMPGMDGLTLARAVRGLPGCATLPLVALSAGVLRQDREAALNAGMSEFLSKPLEPRLLVTALRRHIERRRGTPLRVLPRVGGARDAAPEARLGIAGIDERQLAAPLRGDQALLLSLLRRLVDQLEGLALAPDDSLPALLHKLRGSSQVVGATQLAEAARQLEEALREPGSGDTARLRQALVLRAASLAAAAQPALQAEDTRLAQLREQEALQAASSGDAAPLEPEALTALRELIDAQSTRAAPLVEDLALTLLRQWGPVRLGRLRAALAEFDFRAAAAELDQAGTMVGNHLS